VTQPTPTPSTWRRRTGPFLPGVTHTLLLAVLCNLALELVQLTGTGGYLWRFKSPAFPLLFVLGSLVVWLLVGLVHAVVGRLWVTGALMATATAVVAVADHEKVRLLHEPLYPGDWVFLRNLSFLSDIVGPRVVVLLVVAVLVMALAAFVGARALGRRLATRAPASAPQVPLRTRVVVRVLTGVLCLLGIGYLGGFNNPGNAVRATYDALGASWRPWSQQRNYLGNGFVGGFLYNLPVPAMTRPPDYSKATMARIAARYAAAAARINRHRDPAALRDTNVVMVLSESFSDPLALAGVHLDRDPIPFTRRLMASTTSGAMLAQNIGGGTANMEFEALTGMSMSQLPPQLRVPYQSLVPRFATFPSVVGWLRGEGHRAIAIHPFTTEMYRRRDVYPTLGFQQFVHDDTMHEQATSGHDGYISDQAAFDEVRRRIDGSADPLLVHLVTMQNHIPFPDRYDDPARVRGPDGEQLAQTGQYVRGLSHTDAALADFIGRLERSGERTVVVFYGDHLPATYPDSVFDANGRRTMHQTPFFVWANFAGPDRPQPTTSPIHFVDLMLERAGASVPPYYALLQRLRERLPAMDSGLLVDRHDRLVSRDALPAPVARLLHDYRLVQYDLSTGRRYSEDAMFAATG
jgi:phosphoglycerol transferase MdoB-like AlkP superfamily enzyme